MDELVWSKINKLVNQNKLPHGWIITGHPGAGKTNFALNLTKRLLCLNARQHNNFCNNCLACHQVEQQTHADYYLLSAENSIKIDEIRQLKQFAQRTPSQGIAKVISIINTENMTLAAANGLLKILEEPPAATYFLLITNFCGRLLPTIRSRCCILRLATPANVNLVNQDSLALHQKLINNLVELQESNLLAIADQWQASDDSFENILSALLYLCLDIVRYKLTNSSKQIIHLANQAAIIKLANKFAISTLLAAYDQLQEVYKHVNRRIALNQQLSYEAWLTKLLYAI